MFVSFFNGVLLVIVVIYGLVILVIVVFNVKLVVVIVDVYGLLVGDVVLLVFGWIGLNG